MSSHCKFGSFLAGTCGSRLTGTDFWFGRGALVGGGRISYRAYCGCWALNVGDALSHSTWSVGARLAFSPWRKNIQAKYTKYNELIRETFEACIF